MVSLWLNIVGSRLNSLSDIKVERFDFSDPQGGKGEADRQAATVKGHVYPQGRSVTISASTHTDP